MFIRSKFVTNSSTTSFIFFGIVFDEDTLDSLFEHIVPIEKRDKEAYVRMDEEIWEWVEKRHLEGIQVHYEAEYECGQIFPDGAYYQLEGGVEDLELPLKFIEEHKAQEKEWSKQIEDFCKKYGITPQENRANNNKPSWKIALEIDR
jgi:hypothetical protein